MTGTRNGARSLDAQSATQLGSRQHAAGSGIIRRLRDSKDQRHLRRHTAPSRDGTREELCRRGGTPARQHAGGAGPLSLRAPAALQIVLVLLCSLVSPALFAGQAHAQQGRTDVVTLTLGEGRLLRLDRDATNILIADSSVADIQVVSPRAVYVYGRKPGQTTLSAVDASSGVTAQILLRVSRNLAAAQSGLPPGSGIQLGFLGDRIVVRGTAPGIGPALDAAAAARAAAPDSQPPLDRTRLGGTQQITLRVRIAEVSRSTLDQFGLNLNVFADPGSFALQLLTGTFLGANLGTTPTGSLSGLTGASTFGQASAGFTTRRVAVNTLVNALQNEGLLKLLAEPNLTTLSGETASFLAGGEVPIPVPQSFGVTTIDYKRYGVQLQFTPTLLGGDRIAMRVQPEVSEISSANSVTINGTTVPSFINRRVQSNVEMASGQTLAIAGLFQRNEQTSISRFPWLSDIPILGALFRSVSYQRNETELVILVTPYLSVPVGSASRIPLPGSPPVPVSAGFVVD